MAYIKKILLNQYSIKFFAIAAAMLLVANPALAVDVDDVAENMTQSISEVPGLITGASYLLALIFAVTGVLKLRDHVESPGNGGGQTPLRTPLIRFIIGGALLSLPIIYEAMAGAINGGEELNFDPSEFSFAGFVSGAVGGVSGLFGIGAPDLNGVMASIVGGLEKLPGLITATGYLLGLVIGVSGLLKIREHVENPDQVPMREAIVRLLVGGALFALPTVFGAMTNLINGGDGLGFWGQVSSVFGGMSWFTSQYAGGTPVIGGVCNPAGGTMGSAMCSFIIHTAAAPAFLSALSYLFGLILGVWGILKIRDHALNPTQTTVWEGVSRFVAGGAFFALPVTVEAIRSTLTPASLTAIGSPLGGLIGAITGGAGGTITGYNETATCGGGGIGGVIGAVTGTGGGGDSGGLDGMLFCMMSDLIGPIHSLMNFFTFTAGIIFIMIGISRLTKAAQDGARGPGGIGTFMTFLSGGALISYNELIRGFTGSFFTNPTTLTYGKLSYTEGMGDAAADHAHNVISSLLKFMIVVGLISFVRGIFIIRNVAEGGGQASIMAGITHLVGGSLAVNLGPLLNAVQTTLGITGYGIMFQ